jgi:hypothetical protein
MFGVAAFSGMIRRRAARCPSDRARRDYLPALALADLGCGRVGVLTSHALAQAPGRGVSSGFPFRGHPPLAGPRPHHPAAAGKYAEHVVRHRVVSKRGLTEPWRAPAPVLK